MSRIIFDLLNSRAIGGGLNRLIVLMPIFVRTLQGYLVPKGVGLRGIQLLGSGNHLIFAQCPM